jgi:predicted esterase
MRHSITIKKQAHYHILKPKSSPTKILLVVHGYAQLAEEFITQFEPLRNKDFLVIAPEGLNLFYNKERKPVANWMTSHERNDEIHDYVNYFNKLIESILFEYPELELHVLGFSQGVSTLIRWLAQTEVEIKSIHLIAGSIPPELSQNRMRLINKIVLNYYYGDNDRLLVKESVNEQLKFLRLLKLDYKLFEFKGGHEVPKEFFTNLSSIII